MFKVKVVLIVNFKQISHLTLGFLLLTLNMQLPAERGRGLGISQRTLDQYKH